MLLSWLFKAHLRVTMNIIRGNDSAMLFPTKKAPFAHNSCQFQATFVRNNHAQSVPRSADRYSFTDNAREGRRSKRRVISTTKKRCVYGIRFTAVFYASTIFPAAENRGTISRLTRETGGIVRRLSLERNAGYARFVRQALKESSLL